MISLTINGQTVEVPEGASILDAAGSAGIQIPTLCYHKDLSPFGSCRLCVVEVQGNRFPVTSCNLLAAQGMVIQTESPQLTRHRQVVLKTLLYTYYDGGYKRSNGRTGIDTDSELAYWTNVYGIDLPAAMAKQPRYPLDSDPNPYVWVDMNKCILCNRCVRACAEVQGRFVWSQAYRGFETRIVPGADTSMLQGRCESCGACVVYCPTGALDNKMSVHLGHPDRTVTTTCSYCSVGCQFDLHVKDAEPGGRVMRVASQPAAPVNGLHLCVKGRYGYDFIHRPDRLMRPRLREYLLEGKPRPAARGKWVEVDWDVALNVAAGGLREARDLGGPTSIGLLVSGKCLNEEIYLLNKLARQVLETNNIDRGVHLERANVLDSLVAAFGAGAMTNSLDDVAKNACACLVIGSNLTEQQPVFGARLRQAVLRQGTKLVVADPYPINIAEYGVLHLRYKPGTEPALLNGLMKIILENGWEDHPFIAAHTEGFEEFTAAIAGFSPDLVAEMTGIASEKLYQAARILATNRPMAVISGPGLGVNGAGGQAMAGLANLQLLLGNLGLPGGGVNPLRSENNAQGASDMGGRPDYYPGYQPVSGEARQKFEAAWGTPLPIGAGLTAAEMLAAAGAGKLQALCIFNEDPAASAWDGRTIRSCLEACNFTIVKDIFLSETARFADVLLPGVSFAEETGSFTNTERRIQLVRQAIQPIGEARAGWQIITELARRILAAGGRDIHPEGYASWDYAGTSEIMLEAAALTPIYAGVTHERLAGGEALHWPVESSDHPGTPVLHVGRFVRGRGKFIPVASLAHTAMAG